MSNQPSTEPNEARSSFYAKIDTGNCTPLWEVQRTLVSPEPCTPCMPCQWRWSTVWPWLQEAGQLITTREAERRVLVLENPGLRGQSRITHSLYAGLQLLLPGETAPCHRHSQSALRFVLHGKGAFTTVDGQTVTMHRGDFLITPSWSFHDHGNPADEPMVWLDGLDVPIVQLLDAQFLEHGSDRPRDDLSNSEQSKAAPVICYPWSRTRESLEALRRSDEPHRCFGYRTQYTNPATGGSALPTMGAFIQLMPSGFAGAPYRSSDSTVYAVLEGRGRCIVGTERFEFAPNDVFMCPSWMSYRLETDDESILFGFSDRPVQQALGLWRESC